jgi:hypothetical protein
MDAREKLLGIALLITYRGRDYLLTESDLGSTSRAAVEPQFRGVGEVAGLVSATKQRGDGTRSPRRS